MHNKLSILALLALLAADCPPPIDPECPGGLPKDTTGQCQPQKAARPAPRLSKVP